MFSKIFGESELQQLFRNGMAFNWKIGVFSDQPHKIRFGNTEIAKFGGFVALGVNFEDKEIALDGDLITEYRIPKLYKLSPSRYGDLLYEGNLDGGEVTSIVVAIERNKVVVQSIRFNYSFKFKPIIAQKID